MSHRSRTEAAARRIACGFGSFVHHFLSEPGWRGQMRVSRKWEPRTPALRSPCRLPAWACGSAAQRGHRHRHKHSPIFPLGFVDVTISASANFAALVFKQVLDPLPLAAQLHFKVIVHCHSLRGRGAGSGGRGTGVGTREAPAAAAPGNPPALHPAAAAPARPMRQEQEEAPRERRGHPGRQRGRGRPRVGWDGEVPPGAGEQRDEGWGWGAGVSALVPADSRGAGSSALSGRAFCSRCGERRGGHGGLSSSQTRTHASPSLTHTLTLTHSLTHSPIHSNRKAAPHNSRYLLRERRREGNRGTRPRLSQKRREGSGYLRPSLQPAPQRLSAPAAAGTRRTV